MRSSAALAVLFVVMAADEVRAQPPGRTPPARKSPATAFLTSLGVTAAGGLAIAVGSSVESGELAVGGGVLMLIGPSVGRWYGGARIGTLIGLVGRGAAVGLAIHGLHEDSQPVDVCDEDIDFDCTKHDAAEERHDRKARIFYASAAALWAGATIYDIVMAPLDARAFNREHAVTVAPTVLRGSGQGGAALVPGLALSGRF